MFEKVHAARKAGGEFADIVRRLDQYRSRRIKPAEIIIRSGQRAHLRGVEETVFLAGAFQRQAEALVELHAARGRGGIYLSGRIECLA
ncbi:hypothetical protein D3C71_1576040 [compost metagenome]